MVYLKSLADMIQDSSCDISIESVRVVGDGFSEVDHLIESFLHL